MPAGATAWVPDAWLPSVRPDGTLPVSVVLRDTADPLVTDGQPRAEATANAETIIYRATTEAPPPCP